MFCSSFLLLGVTPSPSFTSGAMQGLAAGVLCCQDGLVSFSSSA